MSSQKYNLLASGAAKNGAKRPRCSAEIAKKYRCKEDAPEFLQNAIRRMDGHDRRAMVGGVVGDLFGGDSPKGLHCEPYLRDALYRWMLASARTPDSWDTYGQRMHRWIAHTGRRSLSAQTDTAPRQVSDFLMALEAEGLAQRTIVSHRDVLRSWFAWLFDRELVFRSPISRDVVRAFRVDHATVLKADGRRQALTLAEAQKVAQWALNQASPEAGLSVLLQVTAALRSQEVAHLERRHLVDRDGLVTLTIPGKGGKGRQVVLEDVVVQAWNRYLTARRRQGTRGPLLVRPGGGPYAVRTIQAWAKEAAAVVGRQIEISSHDLRKTAITLLMEDGADLPTAQGIAGHASMVTTDRCYVVRKARTKARTRVTGQGHNDPTLPQTPLSGHPPEVPLEAPISHDRTFRPAIPRREEKPAVQTPTPLRVLPHPPTHRAGEAREIYAHVRDKNGEQMSKSTQQTPEEKDPAHAAW